MIVIGTAVVEHYLSNHVGHKGIKAVLAATSKASAAARREAPDATVSITRLRKSPE